MHGSAFDRWRWPVAAALATFIVVMILLFPVSCTAYDGPPGYDPPGPECPEAPTLIGLVWPNIYVGFVLTPVIAVLTGAFVGYTVQRRSRVQR